MERWLLKALIGGIASKTLAYLDGKTVKLNPDLPDVERLVDLLFGRTPFAPPVGLYGLMPHKRELSVRQGRGILMALIVSEAGVVGLEITLMHCLLGFMMRNLGFPNAEYESVVYRPQFFRFHEVGGVIRDIELTWTSGSHQGIHLGAFMRAQVMKS